MPGFLQSVSVTVLLTATLVAPARAQAPRFYADDPLSKEPTPVPTPAVERRALSALLEIVNNTFKTRGERHPTTGVIPAQGVNTMGEVMDGDWYVNRHGARRLTIDELQRGPGDSLPPSIDAPWQVLVVRPFGVNPGLLVADAKRDLYILRFDRRGYAGLATGAEMVSSRFLHALGYHVPENYLVGFTRAQLVAIQTGQTVSSAGRPRPLVVDDIDAFLSNVPAAADGKYRAVATRAPERRDALIGPYQVWGTRSDDPNDIVAHEHRRDLRGLFVFSAWLDNTNARAVDTYDVMTAVDGVTRIRHFLVDFTRSLGSGLREGPKLPWEGYEPAYPGLAAMGRQMLSMGLVTPSWMRTNYPDLPEVGSFASDSFDPDAWTTHQPMPAFENRLPDDTFWAARQVMAFTDEDIRAVVRTGRYSEAAERSITATLIERRNRIGRTYLPRVLPLDRFRTTGGTLAFDDLAVVHGLSAAREYTIDWYDFDNEKDTLRARMGTGLALPAAARALAAGAYVAAVIDAGDPNMHVTVYLRRRADGFDVVGLDRSWPGKVIAAPAPLPRVDRRVFADLAEPQQALFADFISAYNTLRGSRYSTEDGFAQLSVSEQTTFYAVTHALMHTRLTDRGGGELGTALDRVVSVERIAGQLAGLAGDQQFRLYVTLKPDSRAVLEKSREFFRDHENTIYHAGYPHSYRQSGREPNLQFSLTEDGRRADIDVDYRSSRAPQGLFNGHLSAANSDVRLGDNSKRHNARWQGLITWWHEVFGRLNAPQTGSADPISSDRPDATPTPVPDDRPAGAVPERIEDAAQEFLTDWLVRHQYDQALEFLSSQATACLNRGDTAKSEALDEAVARRELRRLMTYAAKTIGTPPNLTSAIVAFTPRDARRVVVDHQFRREFLLTPLGKAEAQVYRCDKAERPDAGGEHFGVVFQFRRPGGGTLGLLWAREAGRWKLVSYLPISY